MPRTFNPEVIALVDAIDGFMKLEVSNTLLSRRFIVYLSNPSYYALLSSATHPALLSFVSAAIVLFSLFSFLFACDQKCAATLKRMNLPPKMTLWKAHGWLKFVRHLPFSLPALSTNQGMGVRFFSQLNSCYSVFCVKGDWTIFFNGTGSSLFG